MADAIEAHLNTCVQESDGNCEPFGWVWRVSDTLQWHFTTDPKHIEIVRQMEAGHSNTWDITPLFKLCPPEAAREGDNA